MIAFLASPAAAKAIIGQRLGADYRGYSREKQAISSRSLLPLIRSW